MVVCSYDDDIKTHKGNETKIGLCHLKERNILQLGKNVKYKTFKSKLNL